MWSELRDDQLEFTAHRRSSTVRQILVHQILSERRFFAEFIGLAEPPVETLLPRETTAGVQAYIERLVALAGARLPALAAGDEAFWQAEVPFFDVRRERIWVSGAGCSTRRTTGPRSECACACWRTACRRPTARRRM